MCVLEITPVIATERLTLRGAVRNDAQALCDLANDLSVAKMTTSLPHPFSLANAEAQVQRAMSLDWSQEAQFIIEHHSYGVVGEVGFSRRRGPRPEISCMLGRRYWNRGYATEAVRAALKWLTRSSGRRAVTAGHFSDNPAAGTVLCKAGFLYTGDVELRPSLARGGERVPTRMMVWLA